MQPSRSFSSPVRLLCLFLFALGALLVPAMAVLPSGIEQRQSGSLSRLTSNSRSAAGGVRRVSDTPFDQPGLFSPSRPTLPERDTSESMVDPFPSALVPRAASAEPGWWRSQRSRGRFTNPTNPTTPSGTTKPSGQCYICNRRLSDQNLGRFFYDHRLACGHVFHWACIKHFKENLDNPDRMKCPLCGRVVRL